MGPEVLPATGEISVLVAAPPDRLWGFVSDPAIPARFSDELQAARFAGGARAERGAMIEGVNTRGTFTWTTTSTVVDFEPPTRFRWVTGDLEAPTATWTLEALAVPGGSRLTHTVVMHAGVAPLAPAVEAEPERAAEIVGSRMAEVLANMTRTVEGIAALAEGRLGE